MVRRPRRSSAAMASASPRCAEPGSGRRPWPWCRAGRRGRGARARARLSTQRTRTPARRPAASRSVKLEMRGTADDGHVERTSPSVAGGAADRPATERQRVLGVESRSRPARAGRRGSARRCAASSCAGPSPSSAGSPRNLLMTKPPTRRAQLVGEEPTPCRTGRRRPRPGRCRRRRWPGCRPRRPARGSRGRPSSRLISAGLPAPSQMTTSKRPRRSASAPSTTSAQRRLGALVRRRRSRIRHGRPMTITWLRPVRRRLEQDRVHGHLRLGSRPPAPGPPGPGRSRAPSAVTTELSDMFWALNGATGPRDGPAAGTARPPTVVLPALDAVPHTMSAPCIPVF